MRSILSIAWLLISAHVALAQNLVPNGSFEEYIECPEALNQIERAAGWSRYRGTPDYFNACDGTEFVGVPVNGLGIQEAATGQAYAGSLLWREAPPDGREHLGAQLIEPLIPGVPVYISFKVSPTTNGFFNNMRWTVEGAGLRFTMEPYLENQLAPLPNDAALYMTFPPIDTSTWYQISGVHIPDSAYQYVVLGNFFSDTLITPVVLNQSGTYPAAYIYYDDVCVSYSAVDCAIGTGSDEHDGIGRMRVYPVPFFEQCTVDLDRSYPEALDFFLIDQLGRVIWRGRLEPSQRSFNLRVPGLVAGTYTLQTNSPMGALPPVVLIHLSP